MPWSSRRSLDAYVFAVVAAGIAVVVYSLLVLTSEPIPREWYVLVGLTLLGGAAVIKIPGIPANFTISDTFTITAAVLIGPAAGTVAVAIDCLAISFRLFRAKLPPYRIAFNATAPPLAMWLAVHVLDVFTGSTPLLGRHNDLVHLVGPVAAFAATYFALNTGSIAVAVALEKRLSPIVVWRKHFLVLWLTYFCGGATSTLVAVLVYESTSNLALLAVLVPLPLVLYYAFKNGMGRLEDHIRHLADVNALHLSTIEALAQAIDAKDKGTHGHIRRVHMYATRLAQELGVTAEDEVKAIEAAALLHDMGKIGVPERILNKPGKLTPGEYGRMKVHAALGADILSSIAFPYPVVPIVRHHHERWDGFGYPDGLRALDIPLGARILAVVDCFDALTSERPYRARLSDDAAVDMLKKQRGSAYDPVVVDAFVKIYREVAVHQANPVLSVDTLDAIGRAFHVEPAEVDIRGRDTLDETVAASFFEMAVAASVASSSPEVGRAAWQCVQSLVPATSFVFFVLSEDGDFLDAAYTGGANDELAGLRIPVAQRLTGWVVANQSTIVNGDALLDVMDLPGPLQVPLHSAMSTAVLSGDRSIGAITVYSHQPAVFTDHHAQVLRVVASKLARFTGNRAAGAP